MPVVLVPVTVTTPNAHAGETDDARNSDDGSGAGGGRGGGEAAAFRLHGLVAACLVRADCSLAAADYAAAAVCSLAPSALLQAPLQSGSSGLERLSPIRPPFH